MRNRTSTVISLLPRTIFTNRKEEDDGRQAVFLTPLNPFGKDLGEEKTHSDYTVPHKAPMKPVGKRNQDAVYWVRLKEAQDQGLQVWQTKSFAIMTYVSKRRSRTFREACDTKARTQGHVEAELAKTAAAHFTHIQTYPVSGNRKRPGKARHKCKTARNTLQKRTKCRETGSNSLLTWMWILMSVTKKSAQLHS